MTIQRTEINAGSIPLGAAKCRGSRWAIVLSGGNGERMRPTVESWLGEARPKQYCAFVGSRSMLRHTIDRATEIVPAENVITVIGPGHHAHLEQSERRSLPGRVLGQTLDRGTAPAIFSALAHILELDPEATVLVLPSDTFAFPEERFVAVMKHSLDLAAHFPETAYLLGAAPQASETDYGWIEPLDPWNHDRRNAWMRPLRVVNFHEKPARREAQAYFRDGWLWNTMVFSMNAKSLWEQGQSHLPWMLHAFRVYRKVVHSMYRGGTPEAHAALALSHIYRGMQTCDFSRRLLARMVGAIELLPMSDIEWSDWGRPERIEESLRRLQMTPAFARRNAEASPRLKALRDPDFDSTISLDVAMA